MIPPPATNGRVPTTKNTAAKNGAAKSTNSGAQADPPGVTGFGGMDVSDYV